ncbi:MAG: PHP domain-containing protein, partial [Corallincola sp.]|nr:PHP domain-containing protein [Corallincola sp.]
MGYTELHCLSNFSFLRGASHPEELVAQAHALGYQGLALTDECSLAGVVKAWQAAKALPDFRLIIGTELRFDDGALVVVLAPDREGYAELSTLITAARRRAAKGSYQVDWGELQQLRQALVLWRPPAVDGAVLERGLALARALPGRLWLLAGRSLSAGERQQQQQWQQLAD